MNVVKTRQCYDDKSYLSKCIVNWNKKWWKKDKVKFFWVGVYFKIYKVCSKEYTDPSRLREHKASKHEGVRYPSDQCDYKLQSKYIG